MVNFTILAGGFSSFIATYIFDTNSSTLSLTQQSTTGDNPSWIASHPQNSSILYATNEDSPVGSLQSFLVNTDGSLTLVDTVTSRGNGPTFTNPLSTGEVTAMNFGSPNCSLVATLPDDPLHFQTDSPAVEFPVNGGPSNPHMSLEHGDEVLVTDLGADKIWRLGRDGPAGHFKVQGQIDVAPGNGPRHMAILDGILFVVNELTSTLIALPIPSGPNGTTLPLIANVSTIPEDFADKSTFAVAEILISTPTEQFPNPLIYVSNRNTGTNLDPRGDSIAIFEFQQSCDTNTTSPSLSPRTHARQWQTRQDDSDGSSASDVSGELVLLAQVFTGLQQIRSMALGRVEDGSDEYLIAGANVDGGVAMFQRVDGGRNLTLVARNTEIANRTSFVFV
ncbi:hypothetical protein CVT26_002986 [Gymnopilus dilepis]|uniref:Isomerase YbhE n=1 Tax=Gymnopilus dilepis TaxID=231916 RepID=A0A409Y4G0_9AGAR|nr:hypothetical protein CVT26_002986 [Gymnopilus dilepis]